MEGKELFLDKGTSAEDAIGQLKAARNDHDITTVCLGHQDLALDDGVLSALSELVVNTFEERQWKSIRFYFGYHIAEGDDEGWKNYEKTNGRLGGQIEEWQSNLGRMLGVEEGLERSATSCCMREPDNSSCIGGSHYMKFTNTPIVDLGMTQLHVFSRDGKFDEVLSILQEGNVDVDVSTQTYGWTPAQLASHNGHTDVLQALMENGADIDKLNAIGGSPLREAVSEKHLSAVKLLLERGADANLRADQSQKTPLQLALAGDGDESSDVLDIVRLLLQHGADPDAWNTTGEPDIMSSFGPPLHMAACAGEVNSLTLLLGNGADVSARDSYDRTALHCARSRRVEIFRLLVEHGADINAISGFDGHSALSCAADCYDIEVVRYLVGAGADVEGRVGRDNTPLMCACENRMGTCNIEVVQHLVESGATVNAKNEKGESPLHFACDAHYDNLRVVRYLVEQGADLHVKDGSGKTPYDRSLKEADNANAAWYLLEKEGVDVELLRGGGDVTLYTRNHSSLVNCQTGTRET